MANPHNVELEAAKFLQKLIQESKDEPTKLATKLYVVCICPSLILILNLSNHMLSQVSLVFQILQHMRASGKENSLPYQVISM